MAQGALDTHALLHDLEDDEAEREPLRVPARLDILAAAALE